MSSQVQQQVSPAPHSYQLMSSGTNFRGDSSVPRSFTRRQDSQIIPPTLAYPPSTAELKIHAIVIAIAQDDPNESPLAAVPGDLKLVLDELTERVTSTLQVVTDVQVPNQSETAQMLPPSAQKVEEAIRKVGQAMKEGDICYVYIGGHANQDSPTTAYLPLSLGERLDGKEFINWMKAAATPGGTFVVVADVCYASGFIRLPFVYDVNVNDRSLSCTKSGEKEPQGKTGNVIALLATDYDQVAVAISIPKEPYCGTHGLFTWALFDHVRGQPLEVDTATLLLHLRKQSDWHPSKPSPQILATSENLRQVPLGTRRLPPA